MPGEEKTTIAPPFGLKWDESGERLEEAVRAASAEIIDRRKAEKDREVWEIRGLSQTALKKAYFHLAAGKLAQIELQYGKGDWSPATYDEFMQRVRKRVEDHHGPGRLMARETESTGRNVLKTLVGYRWQDEGGAIELFYFAAQDAQNLVRTLSLHYKSPADATPAAAR